MHGFAARLEFGRAYLRLSSKDSLFAASAKIPASLRNRPKREKRMNHSSENLARFDIDERRSSDPVAIDASIEAAAVPNDPRVARKTAVLVLGMHRSGTSSIAGAVAKLGAKAPNNLLPNAADNERGFFESQSIADLNDEILASAGTRWDDWRRFNPRWRLSPVAGGFEDKAIAVLEEEFGSAPLIVMKDPRFCRMMTPFWSSVMDKAEYDLRVIIPVRSPLEVARSLWLRNGFPISKGLLLWLRHMVDAHAASRAYPTAYVGWSEFLSDWPLTLKRVGEKLGIEWPRLSDISAADIDAFLSPGLRHNSASLDELISHPDVNEWVLNAYEALLTLAEDSSSIVARAALDEIAVKFDMAERIFGRTLVDFEDSQARERHSADIARAERDNAMNEWRRRDEEIARLAQEISVRDQHIAALTQDRDNWVAEAGAQRGRGDHLQAERDNALRDQGRLQDEIGRRDQEIARLHHEIAGRNHEIGVRDQHIAALTQDRDNWVAEAGAQRQRADQLQNEEIPRRDHDIEIRNQHIAALSDERTSATAEVAALRQEVERLTAGNDAAQPT
ncbi:hypothetical protein [Methylocystis heyeri]|uniref:Sulfotransferase family protein n=1 Tax=Methylocystis heyeri TaxID=391905 RepID=A0A6B8KAD4_9HYPH|nr:hypothetical protein [Methylocystis heyeri]QGM44697.1 hypothetical protein H2LOC_002785 [Methylocystis heyeri]